MAEIPRPLSQSKLWKCIIQSARVLNHVSVHLPLSIRILNNESGYDRQKWMMNVSAMVNIKLKEWWILICQHVFPLLPRIIKFVCLISWIRLWANKLTVSCDLTCDQAFFFPGKGRGRGPTHCTRHGNFVMYIHKGSVWSLLCLLAPQCDISVISQKNANQ